MNHDGESRAPPSSPTERSSIYSPILIPTPTPIENPMEELEDLEDDSQWPVPADGAQEVPSNDVVVKDADVVSTGERSKVHDLGKDDPMSPLTLDKNSEAAARADSLNKTEARVASPHANISSHEAVTRKSVEFTGVKEKEKIVEKPLPARKTSPTHDLTSVKSSSKSSASPSSKHTASKDKVQFSQEKSIFLRGKIYFLFCICCSRAR